MFNKNSNGYYLADEPSVYFSDGGGGYPLEKPAHSPLSEPFSKLMESRSANRCSAFVGASGEGGLVSSTQDTFHLHQHHLQSTLNQRQLTHLSPIKTQNSHADQLVFPDRGIECSW